MYKRQLHEVVGSNYTSKVLSVYSKASDEVKDVLVSCTRTQIEHFADDFSGLSQSATILNNGDWVRSWRVLDESIVDASVRSSMDEIQIVNRHYDEIQNYRGGYNLWRYDNIWRYDNLTDPYFNNIDEFIETLNGTGTATESILKSAFYFYKTHNWKELEYLFNTYKINDLYPPAYGGFNIVDNVQILEKQRFDRYGNSFGTNDNGNPILAGDFTSPIKGTPFSFAQRALKGNQNNYDFYYEIEVKQDLSFRAQNADVIPWFGHSGLGQQSKWDMPKNPSSSDGYNFSFTDLAEQGLIKITIRDRPNGTIIQVIE